MQSTTDRLALQIPRTSRALMLRSPRRPAEAGLISVSALREGADVFVVSTRIKWFAKLSMPWVQIVDPFAGEKVGMLVEVDLADNTTAAGLYTHKYLNESVGWVSTF